MATSRFFACSSAGAAGASDRPLLAAMRARSSRKRPRSTGEVSGTGEGSGPRPPLTEMEKQVAALQRAHADALLLFECGYRMRIFAEDAENAAAVLGIRATQHRSFVEASVPVHRALAHSRRLVMAGFKVGIVRQVDSVAARAATGDQRKPLERCVTEMYTRATIPADEDAEEVSVGAARYIMCVVEATVHHKPLFVKLVHEMADTARQHHNSLEAVNIGILAHDVHTGETSFAQFEDDARRQKLKRALSRIEPIEFVLPSGRLSAYSERIIEDYVRESGSRQSRSRSICSEGNKEKLLASIRVERVENAFFDTPTDTSHPALRCFPSSLQLPPLCLHCFCGIHQFLLTLSMEKTLVSPRYTDVRDSISSSISQFALPPESQRDLDVFTNSTTGTYHGSLYSILNHTVTGFGARRLREWIKSPLVSLSEINERQDAVVFLTSTRGFTGSHLAMDVEEELMLTVLPRAKPLLRSIQRIHVGNATPSETISALKILVDVESKMTELSKCVGTAMSRFPEQGSQPNYILHLLNSYPLVASRSLQCLSLIDADLLMKSSNDAERIILRWLYRDENNRKRHQELAAELSDLQTRYADELEACRKVLNDSSLVFKTLRGGSISDIHHLIEVSREKLALVSSDWLPVNSTKTHVRFHTREIVRLQLHEDFARQQQDQLVRKAWSSFISHVDGELYVSAMGCVDVLSTLDALCSLAAVGRQSLNYSMPIFVEGNDGSHVLDIQDGRHPIVETLLEKSSYISNSISLTSRLDRGAVLAVSGPNMGGKTSLLRMCALIVLMAQIGSFVPAIRARLSLFDGVFTIIQRQIWASGGNSSSSSLRDCELSSLSSIARLATRNSLVVVDEIGVALSSHHARALAVAHAVYFVNSVGCLLLFASHVASALKSLAHKLGDRCVLKQFVYTARSSDENEEEDGKIIRHVAFHYVIQDGIARDSLALDTARRAGLPQHIIDRAAAMSEQQRLPAEH